MCDNISLRDISALAQKFSEGKLPIDFASKQYGFLLWAVMQQERRDILDILVQHPPYGRGLAFLPWA